ncbi:evolutionarily conserved signaling intermediate in Toll pathway, mitochondrial isoform X1 [Lithobates pipiens]
MGGRRIQCTRLVIMRTLRWLVSAQNLCASARWLSGIEPCKPQVHLVRMVHSSPIPAPPKANDAPKALTPFEEHFFKQQKDKASFVQVLDVFCGRDVRRRGHVEMIEAALKWMPEFGLERDLEVYNKILDVFPKEVFVPRNLIQTMFNHYPRQQECAIKVLDQMETNGVIPDKNTRFLLMQTFGKLSHPMKKYQRIMYWFPRFKNTNPYPVVAGIEADPVSMSKLCLERMAADKDARITVYQLPSTEQCEDGTVKEHAHLVGIQSTDQMSLLAEHDHNYPVLVEGPFPLWLKKTCVNYYVLRAEPDANKREKTLGPERSLYYPIELDLDLERDLGDDHTFDVDEVDEGPVYAMCMAGDEKLLVKWIQGMQETNPILGEVPVLFRLTSSPHELSVQEQEKESLPPESDEESTQEERLRMER